jgi:hypothetical protein
VIAHLTSDARCLAPAKYLLREKYRNANTDQANENRTSPLAFEAAVPGLWQLLAVAAILFICSGDLGWVGVGLYCGACHSDINALVICPPLELAAERSQVAENTKGWDRSLLCHLISEGASFCGWPDERFGWSPQLATAIHISRWRPHSGASRVHLGNGLEQVLCQDGCIQEERVKLPARAIPVRAPSAMLPTLSPCSPLMLTSALGADPGSAVCAGFYHSHRAGGQALEAELDGYDYNGGHVIACCRRPVIARGAGKPPEERR